LDQSADGLSWIGLHKMDPWTTWIPTTLMVQVKQSVQSDVCVCVSALRLHRLSVCGQYVLF